MSLSVLSSVHSRMASIEQRFGRRPDLAGGVATAVPRADHVGTRNVGGSALGVGLIDVSSAATSGTGALPAADRTAVAATGGVTVGVAAATEPGWGGAVALGTPFAQTFEAAGARHGVPPRLLAAVGWVESRYQVDAISPDGAIGVMQIMPMTATELGVDPTDPEAAIDGAARLLASHRSRFGTWDLALAAYHSGGGAVSRAGNTAPPRAAEYVRRVHARLEQA
jgi:peptidoglycan DL-endopeptidase CwlO